MTDRYDTIGQGYTATRREDPLIARRIHAALGDAGTVVNVGAGAGSYEPDDRYVIAVEASDVMAAQRPPGRVPAIRAAAENLPLRDGSVDAAMAVLTLHHWDAARERGVRELRRVARDRVVILTYDASVSARMWLMADYLPRSPSSTRAPSRRSTRSSRGSAMMSVWSRSRCTATPRTGCSGRSAALRRDLADGTWDARHGHLRVLDEHDVGLRLVVARRQRR